MEPLQHFCHPEHPLVFNQDERSGRLCWGCRETVLGPSYSCKECDRFFHHKSCAELPLGLHHPLHPIHPLILFDEVRSYPEEKEKSKCEVCKESRSEYTYRCYRCDFNLHVRCASLLPTLEAEFHDHPLTPFWNWITFTCDLCGIKEDKGMPYLCNPCGFSIHRKCAYFPRRLKVVRHKHPLHITHSSLELHESDSRFCLLCVQKAIFPPFYSCAKCSFFLHKSCANLPIKKRHPLHPHPLTLLTKSPHNNESFRCDTCFQRCNGFVYTCVPCWFELDVQCNLVPEILTHEGHKHQLILSYTSFEQSCSSCGDRRYRVFRCTSCEFALDFKCATLPQPTRYK